MFIPLPGQTGETCPYGEFICILGAARMTQAVWFRHLAPDEVSDICRVSKRQWAFGGSDGQDPEFMWSQEPDMVMRLRIRPQPTQGGRTSVVPDPPYGYTAVVDFVDGEDRRMGLIRTHWNRIKRGLRAERNNPFIHKRQQSHPEFCLESYLYRPHDTIAQEARMETI